ncbi:hypothetical protein [Rhizobium bangladeshense]|uniref:hypothetical protein n=1 Tax=Rhizobium bangladeshense TaxID=1138189 RepID=UPI0007E58D3D|nr:hypothetical protein [Rhizobium bangladeshense]
MSDGYSEICNLADLLDDKKRERLLSVAGTAFDAVEEFFGALREMTRSPGTFAKPCLAITPSLVSLDDYARLYEQAPAHGFHKLLVVEGFEGIEVGEIATLILAAEKSAFPALLGVALATRAVADLGDDNGRLVNFYQKTAAFLDCLDRPNRLEH